MGIKSITPSQVLDSRGEPTLKVKITSDEGHSDYFVVPSGASVGADEAQKKTDQSSSYGGLSVNSCIDLINNVISPKFIGYPLGHQSDFDSLLIALDGTPNKEKLGANTILALSGAYFKLSAKITQKPLWQYIAEQTGSSPRFPKIFANLIGGGKHAPGLEIQEFMMVPQSEKPIEAIEQIVQTYKTIGTIMTSLYGPTAKLVGDEGAIAPTGARTEVVLEALHNLAAKSESKFDIAIDAAANSFYNGKDYDFEGQKIHADILLKTYQDLDSKYDLYSIEDPFAEADIEGMELLKTMPKDKKAFKVFSDDFTVTSADKITQFAQEKIFDGVIIKPDQVGSITEMLYAIKTAKELGQEIIVSHRSGENNDSFIVDLAYGIAANGIKIGAPSRGERIAKYNRLLEIAYSQEAGQANFDSASSVPIMPAQTTAGEQPPATQRPQTAAGTVAAPNQNSPKLSAVAAAPSTNNPSAVSAASASPAPVNPKEPIDIMNLSPPPAGQNNPAPIEIPKPNASTPQVQKVITASGQGPDGMAKPSMRTNMPNDLAKSFNRNDQAENEQGPDSPLSIL